jgi:anti-sigma factor RsiW
VTCRDVIDFLMEYFQGELPPAERALFEEHFAECPDCVAYLDSYRETIRLGKAACCDPADPICKELPEDLVHAILAARSQASGGR